MAIIDGADTLGGLCILRGCMPSKTLIYSAEVLHHAKKGKSFGLDIPTAEADMSALQKRKQKIIDEFAEYRQEQLESDRFTLFRNRARFIDPQTIELDNGQRLTADHFMIATGSSVAVPPVPGLAEAPCWTSDDVLDLDFLPERVIVLGGGIVACELAQCLRRLGSEVILIQRNPRLLKQMPEAASLTIENAFREEGIDLYTGTNLQSVHHTDNLLKSKRHICSTRSAECRRLKACTSKRRESKQSRVDTSPAISFRRRPTRRSTPVAMSPDRMRLFM